MMENTHYLPDEELKGSNYPEVVELQGDIDKLEAFAEEVNSAIAWFNEAYYDKIDLDIIEVQKHVDLCRTVCDKLARAPKICFEVLTDLREMQVNFQEILYLKRRYGDEYVGTPMTEEEEENQDVGGEI